MTPDKHRHGKSSIDAAGNEQHWPIADKSECCGLARGDRNAVHFDAALTGQQIDSVIARSAASAANRDDRVTLAIECLFERVRSDERLATGIANQRDQVLHCDDEWRTAPA